MASIQEFLVGGLGILQILARASCGRRCLSLSILSVNYGSAYFDMVNLRRSLEARS